MASTEIDCLSSNFIQKMNSRFVINKYRHQTTLKTSISYSGIGLHTGEIVTMRFCPAPPNSGIVFKRMDLIDQPCLPAKLPYVQDTHGRSTTLGHGNIRIHTVEHVMAAVAAFGITNLYIELSNIEPPIANGSSDVFVKMIEDAGVIAYDEKEPIYTLTKPVWWSSHDIHMVALPHDDFHISYTLSYPTCSVLKSQYHSIEITAQNFKNEIASCRTFARYEEISSLIERGLIRGASLDNAVLIKDGAALSKGGLFFSNEMARHKILDMVGDLSLIGCPIEAHIIAIKSGHAENHAFALELTKHADTNCML